MSGVALDAGLLAAGAGPRLSAYFDWTATLLWATSGAMLGARRGFDIPGVFVVALVSATGGGLLRDGLFLQQGPPVLLRTPIYLELVAIAVAGVVLFGRLLRRFRWFNSLVAIVDGVGLGAYAVVGMKLALAARLPVLSVMVVGMVNAVGGSLLRDLLIGDKPQVVLPGVWLSTAALAGCLLFVALLHFQWDAGSAGLATVALVFLIRMAALRLDLRSRPLSAFADDWRE